MSIAVTRVQPQIPPNRTLTSCRELPGVISLERNLTMVKDFFSPEELAAINKYLLSFNERNFQDVKEGVFSLYSGVLELEVESNDLVLPNIKAKNMRCPRYPIMPEELKEVVRNAIDSFLRILRNSFSEDWGEFTDHMACQERCSRFFFLRYYIRSKCGHPGNPWHKDMLERSCVINLSDSRNWTGGEFVVRDENNEVSVRPGKNEAVVFIDQLEHCVRPIQTQHEQTFRDILIICVGFKK